MWDLLHLCLGELSEQYLISIVERMPQVCSATLMSQKFRLHSVKQNDSMIYFLSLLLYLFYTLISEYIEKLNCVYFIKTGEIEVF